MADNLKLLLIILVVPALGIVTALGAQRQVGPNSLAGVLGDGAALTAIAGLALMGLIAAAAAAARSDRHRLLTLFRPGLYITAIAITGLIIAHALIAVVTLYYAESIVLNRVYFGAIVVIGIGAIAGVLAVAKNAFTIVQKAETHAIGTAVSRADAPALWACIDATAARLSSLRPDHVVVGLDPTFYVTEANVRTLNGLVEGRTLFCSLPLARILTTDEFTAVIAHELGHFRGEDTRFSAEFYPIYRGTIASIHSIQAAGGRGWGQVALLPALAVFSFFLRCFAMADSRHSRERELLADRAAVEATSATSIAVALVKVHAFAGVWSQLQGAAIASMQNGRIFVNASETYAAAIAANVSPASFEGIATAHTSHPTDSHPPLSVRLEALGLDLAGTLEAAARVAPPDAAIALVADHETRERAISEAYQVLLARRLNLRLPAAGTSTANAGPIRRCAACGMKVMPTREQKCPSCGAWNRWEN